jgi:TRAP transporter TAXI family solute receptor
MEEEDRHSVGKFQTMERRTAMEKKSCFTKFITGTLISLLAVLFMADSATAAPATPPIPEYRFTVGTAATGSTGHATGSIIASFVTRKTNGRIRIAAVPTTGSVDALQRLRKGEIQIAGSGTYPTLYEAMKNLGHFKNMPSLQAYPLFPMSRSIFQTVMRAETDIEKWGDLSGKRIAGGSPGSIGAIMTGRWLEIAGIQDKVEVVDLAFNAAVDALRDNKIVMSQMLTAAPNSNIMEFQTRNPIKFLDFDQTMLNEMAKRYYGGAQFFALTSLTKKVYPNLTREAKLASYLQPWSVRRDFPEDAAYWIVKVIWDNLPELYKLHRALTAINDETLKQMPDALPIHPGALKYYKEKGLR